MTLTFRFVCTHVPPLPEDILAMRFWPSEYETHASQLGDLIRAAGLKFVNKLFRDFLDVCIEKHKVNQPEVYDSMFCSPPDAKFTVSITDTLINKKT